MENSLPPFAAPPRNLLVRGVNWLGDAVMTTPALLRLREALPQTRITMLAPENLADLWRHDPAVDETLVFSRGQSILSLSRRLAAHRFDYALVLPNSPRSALEAWLARIPRRIGYARPWRTLLLTTAVPPRPGAATMTKRSRAEIRQLVGGENRPRSAAAADPRAEPAPAQPAASHQIHEYLHLAARGFGARSEPLPPRLALQPGELEEIGMKFRIAGESRPVFAMAPGAEYGPAKRWPEDRFIAAGREIQKRANCLWLVLGSRGDVEIAGRIASGLGRSNSLIRDLAGQTALRELCGLLKLSRVLLTNDTGSMHVAAALGTPVVALFGSTSPELTGPGLAGDGKHQILKSGAICSPCFLRDCPIDFRCMTGIGVGEAVKSVLEAASP